MQRNLRWILATAAAGCIVAPPLTDTADTDPAQGTDTGETDVADTEPGDTWIEIDTGDTPNGGDTGALAFCHPFDPMDKSPWRRVYRITEGARQGTETQDGLGQVNAPANWPSQAAQSVGFGYTSSVTLGGNTQPVTTYLIDCKPGPNGLGDRAVEIGYHVPNSNLEPVVVGAKTPRVYLPSKAEFGGFGFSEQQSMDFRVLAQQRFQDPFNCLPGNPPCLREARYTFKTTNTVTSLGEETITVQGLGQVAAQKVQYVIDQQIVKDPNLNPFSIFGDIFGSIFSVGGLQATGENQYNAEITRWWVEGVGLVREQSVDITTKAVTSTKELTACSGLPGC